MRKSKIIKDGNITTTTSPCKFADDEGRCRNKSNQGGGFICCTCESYTPQTELEVATQKAEAWLSVREGADGTGEGEAKVPTTLTVRVHKHVVNVPVAEALTRQYERVGRVANAALKEMVVFGAMLDRIDKALSANRHNPDGQGVSIRSWLAENCPGIEYATAMDYKRTTRNYLAYMKLKEDTPLLEMMQADPYDDAEKETLRRRILDSMTGLTKTQLRKLTDASKENALKGTHGLAEGRRALTAAEKAAEASREAKELLGRVGAWLRSGQFALLTEDQQGDFIQTLKDYAKDADRQIEVR